uniref:Endo/exonuclease/phosphatase domain-containing protein n=1 Tax=Haemonchus contortus TaxID=6289 RepID=A0A7I4YXD2_HAECO
MNIDSYESLTNPALTTCLRTNIELRRRGVSGGSGEALQRSRTSFEAIVGDFNATEECHIGAHGVGWSEKGQRLSEFIMSTHTIHGNSQF